MEYIDPLGIYTDEFISIAPIQTLSNHENNLLRNVSIKIVRYLGIVGSCTVKFALNPMSNEHYIIKVNAYLSRSSTFASKSTGFPLAYVATKLVLGKSLVQLKK